MLTEVWVAVAGAIVSVSLFLCGKRAERQFKEREIKQEKYIGFLESLIAYKTLSGDPAIGLEVSKMLQSVYLVGNKKVVSSTRRLIEALETGNVATKTAQDELYTAMVYAMKTDIYKTKQPDKWPTKLGLTTFK